MTHYSLIGATLTFQLVVAASDSSISSPAGNGYVLKGIDIDLKHMWLEIKATPIFELTLQIEARCQMPPPSITTRTVGNSVQSVQYPSIKATFHNQTEYTKFSQRIRNLVKGKGMTF